MDRVARAYGVRPSAMIGLNHPHPPTPSPAGERELKSPLDEKGRAFGSGDWVSYTFDRAVWMWGQWVESKLTERDPQGRPVWSLERILSDAKPIGAENFGGADQLVALAGEGVRIKP